MTKVKLSEVIRRCQTRADRYDTNLLYYVAGEHFESGEIDLAGRGEIAGSTIGPMFYYGFKPGDFLLVSRNPHLRKASRVDFAGVCSEKTFVLETADESVLSNEYLPWVLQNDRFWNYAQENRHGSTNFFINWSTLADYVFELPSIEDQKRIATILWAAQSVRRNYRKLLKACDDVVKSQFVDAVQSAHNPSFVRLDDLVREGRPITYGIVKPGGNVEDGIPIIKVKDYPNGTIDESNLLYASPAIEEKYARSRLKQGDLLFSIRGSVGRMAFVPASLVGANLTQDTARLSLREELDPEYIRGVLRLPEVDHWIRHHIKGVAVQGVNLRDLRNLEIPILSEDKQAELGRFVASVDKSKFAVQKALDELNATTKKILNQELGLGDV